MEGGEAVGLILAAGVATLGAAWWFLRPQQHAEVGSDAAEAVPRGGAAADATAPRAGSSPHMGAGAGSASGAELLGVSVSRASAEGGPTLVSSMGVDYAPLRDLMEAKDFKAADAETRRLLIVLAGKAAEKRGWVYFSEVKTIPVEDMSTLEGLWQHYSKGKFGFVAQRKIWRQCRSQFDKFAEQVSWFTDKWKNRNWPDEFIYDLDAPVGHLPLTNCIRGAQVLEELLNHTAFEKKKVEQATSIASAKKPSEASGKKSALSMLALGGGAGAAPAGSPRPRALAGGTPAR